jgi:ABC-type multidrug transport system ATPase subunit
VAGLEARHRVEAAARAAAFPLEALAQRPAAWSGGMAQRLALARALVFGPRILVLDEPFAGLDPLLAETLETVLAGLQARGTALVLATHGLPGATRLCGSGLWLSGGRVAGQGPLSTPQSEGPRPGALAAPSA